MKRSTLLAMALISVLFANATSWAGSQWAVLVGIDKYHNPGISTLNGAANDAKSLAKTLKDELGFPERHVFVYTSDAPAAYQPTTGNIVRGLEYVARKAKPGDTFIMFFAGHGITSRGSGYLLTYHSDMGAVELTALPLVKLNQLLASIRVSHRLFLVDACRNKPEEGRGDEANRMSSEFAWGISVVPVSGTGKGVEVAATLFSCEMGQRAYELPQEQRGFFSYYLEKGLTSEAADKAGRVTLSSLVSYLRREVSDQVQRVLGVNKHQVPWVKMEGDDPGSWVINSLKGGRLAELNKGMEARKKELDRLSQLGAKTRKAQAKKQAETAGRERELVQLDAQIEEMRQPLGTPAVRSDDSLDAMLAMVRQKKQQQWRLEELKRKRREEEAKRRAEIERLKAAKRAHLVKRLKEDIRKYQEIVSSPFGKDMKEAAWRSLVAKYPEAMEDVETYDTEGLLFKVVDGGIVNSIDMKFMHIPAGSFTMGSPPDDPSRASDERQHKVTISKPFYLQTTEVTQGQWVRVMGNNPSYFNNCGNDCPVERVSWIDAQEFIRRLNQMEGTDKYRPPTEAEWEYACRAGTTTPFYTGNCVSTDQANYEGNHPMPGCPEGKYRQTVLRVGSFEPNAWGLYDMHGNVWEWCQDWYGEYSRGHVIDPTGPSSGETRVLRGGSWNLFARDLRSANRNGGDQDSRGNVAGFRVAREP